jgi:hypothetical protein
VFNQAYYLEGVKHVTIMVWRIWQKCGPQWCGTTIITVHLMMPCWTINYLLFWVILNCSDLRESSCCADRMGKQLCKSVRQTEVSAFFWFMARCACLLSKQMCLFESA